MQEDKDPFGETLYKQLSSRTQGQEEDHCCPWSDELQNYRKQPGFTQRRAQAHAERRKTFELQNHRPRPRLKEPKCERDSPLPCNSVTIEYQVNRSLNLKRRPETILKLPILTTRRNSLKDRISEGWGVLGENRQGSLKRYTPRLHCGQSPPQFQIYKRSLLAARRFVQNAILNPNVTLEYLNSL